MPRQLPPRNFSTTVQPLSESVEPVQQERQVSERPSETAHEHEAAGAKPTAEIQHNPARHTPSPVLQRTESDWEYLKTARRITGTVIRTHTMSKTVAVATTRQYFDRRLQTHYTKPSKVLVHDPQEMLIEGDVIEYGLFPPVERAQRIKMGKGKRVKYMVMRVVTPFGVPLEQRSNGLVTSSAAPLERREDAEVGGEGKVRATLQS